MQLFTNVVSVEYFNTSDFSGSNVQNDHTFAWRQGYIPMTRAEAAFWLGLRVEPGAAVIPATATFEHHQSRQLCGQLGFALLFEKLTKLGSERRERVGE